MLLNWFQPLKTWWQRKRGSTELTSAVSIPSHESKATLPTAVRLTQLVLAEGVARTLFADYAFHRSSPRHQEEIGWVLLGLRQEGYAQALAALPAGTQREAGVAHVEFNRDAQVLASRILRQKDKRLRMLGVVHTHPGGLRRPSAGDFQGDRLWVHQLRGHEGIFGIGTDDAMEQEVLGSCEDHEQSNQELHFSWYALGENDPSYRPLTVEINRGIDLAEPLHRIWNVLETHAIALNRLCRQLAQVQFEVNENLNENFLGVKIPLAKPHEHLRLLLTEHEARYYWERRGELIVVDPKEFPLDRAVYLILAELSRQSASTPCEEPSLVES